MKRITHTILLLMMTSSMALGQAFITTWKTDNPGTSGSNQITLPLSGSGYNFDVDWGDGNSDTGVTNSGPVTHTYTSPGTYTISITGDFPRMRFNSGGDKDKILTIEAWGDIEWQSMDLAFAGCFNLTINAPDAPDLSNVTSLISSFAACKALVDGFENWDVSTITDMSFTFFNSPKVNCDLSAWDVSHVTTMSGLFGGNSLSDFNGDISGWDVSQVTNMASMFSNAEDFNVDISNWNVSNVTTMQSMFFGARSFNRDISGWDVGSVATMQSMFFDADSFDQNLGDWDVSAVTNMAQMFGSSGMTSLNYDRTLLGWSEQSLQNDVELGASGVMYCSNLARQALIDNFNWTITGDSQSSTCSFITTWKTDNPGSSNSNQITLPTLAGGGGYNYTVDWGDGNIDTGVTSSSPNTHTYASPGTYTVTISGSFPRFFFNNAGDKKKLLIVEQWGDIVWNRFDFFGCSNLQVTAADAPDLSGVTDISNMFRDCTSLTGGVSNWNTENIVFMLNVFMGATSFNGDIGNWNTSNVENMSSMFAQCTVFNQDIGNWNTSNVKFFNSMFIDARDFNQNIGSWNTSSAIDMNGMFFQAFDFNQDISDWNTSNVTNMRVMFYRALAFDQNISSWNTSNVTITKSMFFASPFNQDISSWDVSKVTDMDFMFAQSGFNQDLSNWDVSSVTKMVDIFDLSALSSANYDKILNGWAQQTLQDNVTFGAEGVKYCEGSVARQSIIDTYNWAITDGGEYCVVNIPDANFKAALLANASINTMDDGEITFEEAEAFTGHINVTTKGIDDMTGLEAFINITNLSCSNNQLTDLDVSQNTKLTVLTSTDNAFTSLDVSSLSDLTTLFLGSNDLTSLDVSLNTKLVFLEVQNNPIPELDLSNNPQLRRIRAYNTSLTTLDLSANTAIDDVRLEDNSLESLDLRNGNNAAITTFDLTGNPFLSCISVDDVAYAEANFTDVDPVANFSTNCSNTATDITAFSFPEQVADAVIDGSNHSIEIQVAASADFGNLTPTITISSGATIDPASGVAQDFSAPFVYTVTSENPAVSQQWTINAILPKQPQTITFNPIEDQFLEAGSLTLSATASSGLPVSFDVVSGPATLSGNEVSFTGLGVVTISASQAGNEQFFAAAPVEQSFEVITITGLERESFQLVVYPNPTTDVLTVQTQDDVRIKLFNSYGGEVMDIQPNVGNRISHLANGIYIVRISGTHGYTTRKIIKK